MAIHAKKLSYHHERTSGQSGRAYFALRDGNGERVGEIWFVYSKEGFLNPKMRQGSHGKVKYPVNEAFPSRIVLDRGEPEQKPKAAQPVFMPQ